MSEDEVIIEAPVNGVMTMNGNPLDPDDYIEVTTFGDTRRRFVKVRNAPPEFYPRPWTDEEKAQWPNLCEWCRLRGEA